MKIKNKKEAIVFIAMMGLVFLFFMAYQIITTYKAHETFSGYCKWRGLEVVNKSADYGYCENNKSGEIFKMVLVDKRWYLDGDLPNNWPF